MPKVEVDVDTSVSPERVRAALLDFSERRPEIWPGLAADLYEVYEVGDTWADVKEGSTMPGTSIWAKEHYDWSSPEVVTWTVRESNFCTPGSFVSARITPREGGGSRIHVVWSRTGTSMVGRFAVAMIKATRGKPVVASLKKGLAQLEAAPAA